MRVLLISSNTESLTMPVHPGGMHLVADAAERSGHEVRRLDLFGVEDIPSALAAAVAEHEPQVIGLTVRNIDDQCMQDPQFLLEGDRRVVRWLRELSPAPVVLGGAGYSIYPDSVLEYLGADMGLAGEGEASFPRLLDALEQGGGLDGVEGLHVRGQGETTPRRAIRRLDACPLPSPDTLSAALTRREDFLMPYQTRRGCPFDCSYCSTSSIEGRRIRKRSVERVVQNLKSFQQAGVRRFFFVDNTFNLPAGYAAELCRGMIAAELDIEWFAIVYPTALSPELVRLMARAGCKQVSLGFESGSDPVLSALNKKFSKEEVRQASELFAEAGIERMGFLLLGGPGETRSTVKESLGFAESLGLEGLKLTVGIRIYPGTILAGQAVQAGLVSAGDTLLRPRFYLEPGLSPWIEEYIEAWAAERPQLVVP
jgi:radical SAM superfamily enzyme YgiQ (UPF0313 family)